MSHRRSLIDEGYDFAKDAAAEAEDLSGMSGVRKLLVSY